MAMAGCGSKAIRCQLTAVMVLAVVAMAGGCASSGGLSLFPTGDYLMRRTRELAQSAPRVPAVPRELAKTVLPAYYIQPGDALLVEPADFDSPVRFPADQTVLADGTIDLGRYGRLVVAGMTVEEIEQLVQETVEQVEGRVDPINVRLIETQSAVFYVLGEVNAPGSYPLIGRETVLDAIMAAGGLTNRASTCEIVLSRPTPPTGCRVVLPICYRHITQMGDTSTNYQILPGDRIYVGTRRFCEELMFWRTDDACPLCSGKLQCPCPEPSIAGGENPIAAVPASPLPPRRPEPIERPEPLAGEADEPIEMPVLLPQE